jgi:thiamine-phosphate pyrophosphorylase
MVGIMQHRIERVGRRATGGVPVPRHWLLSDPLRLPDPTAWLRRLPRGSAVLLRGAAPEVVRQVARLARARGLVLLIAGDGRAALAARAGLHVPDRRAHRHLLPFLLMRRHAANRPRRLLSLAVHGRAGVARARRLGADVALVSPAFPTESHPGAAGLGPNRWAALARAMPCPAVALGGMTARTARRLPSRWRVGWAAIGAWAGMDAATCVVPATVSQGSRARPD